MTPVCQQKANKEAVSEEGVEPPTPEDTRFTAGRSATAATHSHTAKPPTGNPNQRHLHHMLFN